jgi:hypothetical protein
MNHLKKLFIIAALVTSVSSCLVAMESNKPKLSNDVNSTEEISMYLTVTDESINIVFRSIQGELQGAAPVINREDTALLSSKENSDESLTSIVNHASSSVEATKINDDGDKEDGENQLSEFSAGPSRTQAVLASSIAKINTQTTGNNK